TIAQLVQLENQQQAADQISISNGVGSLRLLSAIDWREFVEAVSVVETLLRHDPRGVYERMEFATRDHYRHATERIARQAGLEEAEIAAKALDLARLSAERGECDDRVAHVGYYLIGEGLREL